jgi:signal peptide peptidase SppA
MHLSESKPTLSQTSGELRSRLQILTRSPIWAIAPEAALAAILRLTEAEASFSSKPAPAAGFKGDNKIAIIPIQGVLTKDGPAWYGSNYDTITSALESAGADSAVKRIVLSVDSPGGDVSGLQETADVLSQVAKIKPVSAIVEGDSASAAYWLTSQAHDVTLTPSGQVGSVGVRMMHVDVSKMLTDMGYTITELYSGDFKTEWSPYRPLSDEAVADMQPRLQAKHKDFISAVASGRGGRATADITRKRFGEGRMFDAKAALGHGLVDRIQSAREFYKTVMASADDPAPAFGLTRARLDLEKARRF